MREESRYWKSFRGSFIPQNLSGGGRKPRIIADSKIPFLRGALEGIADISYHPGNEINHQVVKDADALIIRTRTNCNKELLQGSKLKFIATATIGYDHIDTAWCKQNGVHWTNAPGCNSSSVQQYIVSALLEVFTKFHLNPANLTIGIVGVGNVGAKVAKAAEILGMNVMLNDPPRARNEKNVSFFSLDEIIHKADIITFHVPLTKEDPDKTLHLASDSFFNKLQKNIILINTSRGPVVSQPSLKDAIKRQKVKACILDVWEGEPTIDPEMLEMAFLGTPHIAGYSTDGKVNGTIMSIRALSNYFKLGLDNWYPSEVPLPSSPNIACDCTGKTEMEILKEVYLQTYSIKLDDLQLREEIVKFESLRGNYHVRREPPAYNIRLINNAYEGLPEKLAGLGFEVHERDICF